jgi:hypothetical protein
MEEPDTPGDAWLLEDPRRGVWCAFKERGPLEALGAEVGKWLETSNFQGNPGYAWIRLRGGELTSITVERISEDANTEDRYFFDASGRVVELRRTGFYIHDERATYVFKRDAAGRLALTPQSRALRKRVERLEYQTYFLEWPLYQRLSEFPFARLIGRRDGKPVVKSGCTPPGTEKNRAH